MLEQLIALGAAVRAARARRPRRAPLHRRRDRRGRARLRALAAAGGRRPRRWPSSARTSRDASETEITVSDYLALIDALGQADTTANVSIKLTSLGLDLSEALCRERLATVLDRAATPTRCSCASTWRARAAPTRRSRSGEGLQREGREQVGVVLQSMLRRTVDDARALAREQAPVRVCKGIYREPASIAYQDPDAVRASYLETVHILLEGGSKVAVATHDERLIDAVWKLVDDTGTGELVEQQMLLGVRESLRGELRGRRPADSRLRAVRRPLVRVLAAATAGEPEGRRPRRACGARPRPLSLR